MATTGDIRGGLDGLPGAPAAPLMAKLREIVGLSWALERQTAHALGVNTTDFAAMGHLNAHGPLTARELADRLRVSTAAATHIVDRLERAGHVTRQPHADDRRKILVQPRAASLEAAMTMLDPLRSGLRSAVDRLDERDRAVIDDFLGTVLALYETATGPAAPPP